jgi:hypothetical protein
MILRLLWVGTGLCPFAWVACLIVGDVTIEAFLRYYMVGWGAFLILDRGRIWTNRGCYSSAALSLTSTGTRSPPCG